MPPLEGQRIAHYEVLERAGAGAMGVVWKAQDTRLGRLVALKAVPAARNGNPSFRARLLAEARAASQLDHPNICSIYQIEELPGDEILVVMAFYRGETLARRLTRGALPPHAALEITQQLLSGLGHAHRHGVIHRDVKPANLMLLEDGTLKIVDFGLAKNISAENDLTAPGNMVGTVSYMSPEQVLCQGLDHRADLWASGVVLYEMLAGVPPFIAESTYGVCNAILTGQPRRLSDHGMPLPVHLDGFLDAILDRALHKNLGHRFQSAEGFLAALGGRSAAQAVQLPASQLPAAQQLAAPGPAPALPPAPIPQDRSLVVLPFTSPETDEDTRDFCDGLADEIITDLSGVRSLRTICSASAMRLKNSDQSLGAIAQELGVRFVLRGTVRLGPARNSTSEAPGERDAGPAGRSIRVTVQLIDPPRDSVVWADKYRGTVDDIFTIQETISRQIVASLKVTLSPEESRLLEVRPVPDVRALQFYVKAKHEILSYSRQGLERALEYLEMGERIVGANVVLLCARGQVHWQFVNAGLSSDPGHLGRAKRCAAEAALLDPDSPHVLRLRGLISLQEGRTQEAVLLLKRAVAADPNDSDSLSWYSAVCALSGKAHAAMPLARRILEIDPLTPVYRFVPGLLSLMAGEFNEALPSFEEALHLDPGNAMLLFFRGHALALAGRSDDARAQFAALEQHCGDHYFCQLGAILSAALSGDAALAGKLTTSPFEEITACDGHYSWALAEAHALLGHGDDAIRWLDTAIKNGFLNYPMIARWDPLLAGARKAPAFAELRRRVHALWEAFEV